MILPGSYANGFAPRDGQQRHPELWRGCVFAAAPMLGPSGSTLRDWSGFGNHGTLTNGAFWTVDSGRYAVEFDGTNDKISGIGGLPSYSFIHTTGRFSLAFWARFDSNGTRLTVAGSTLTTSEKGVFCLRENLASYGTNVMRIVVYSGASGFFALTGSTADGVAVTGSMDHWCYTSNFSNTVGQWYKNGIAVTTTSRFNAVDATLGSLGSGDSSRSLSLGVATWTSDLLPMDGTLDDVRLYNRALSANEVLILASRRGIAYELAPRRRASAAVAASFNRRRRLLVGAGS